MDKSDHRWERFRDMLHDLWGMGFTITRRQNDPFEIDPKLIPRGMSYQWNIEPGYPLRPGTADSDVNAFIPTGAWRAVPYSRHEGIFAPWGTVGYIEVGGLFLCEREAHVVESAKRQSTSRAKQQVEDWAQKVGAQGFAGGVRTLEQNGGEAQQVQERVVGNPHPEIFERQTTKTIETTVHIPRDMTPYIDRIFTERDRLEAEVVRPDRTLAPGPVADAFNAALEANERDGTDFQWWPTLRAILLPIAVDNVRDQMGLKGPLRRKLEEETAKSKETPDE